MNIHDCLLDTSNTFDIEGIPLGQRVRNNKHEHLWGERKSSCIDTVVIHYTSAVAVFPDDPYNLGRILKIFCDYDVSSHFLIERDGAVHRLVPEEMKAWHCGGSIMPEPDLRTGVNDFSVGIELVATHTSGFTSEQYASLAAICDAIERCSGKQVTYLGHEHVAGVEAVRRGLRQDLKVDPGPLFDWNYFRESLNKLAVF